MVYEIPCGCGQTYTCWRDQEGPGDQTDVAPNCHKKRRNGGVSDCRTYLDLPTSACLGGDLDPRPGNTNILKKILKEAIHISLRSENELMNRDQGVEIDSWLVPHSEETIKTRYSA